jgi:hypothetical protein
MEQTIDFLFEYKTQRSMFTAYYVEPLSFPLANLCKCYKLNFKECDFFWNEQQIEPTKSPKELNIPINSMTTIYAIKSAK